MSRGDGLLLFLIFPIASALMLEGGFQLVRAQTVVATTAHVDVDPNLIGVCQTANVSMWIEPPPPSPQGNLSGLILQVVNPDNMTTWWVGPFFTDSSGSVFVILVFDQVGSYALQLNYTGESFADGAILYGSATSAVIKLNVTQDIPAPTSGPTPSPASTLEPTHMPSPSMPPSATPLSSTTQPIAVPLPSPILSPSLVPNPHSEPFPTALSTSGVSTIVIVAGLLVYLKKRRPTIGDKS